MPGSLWGFPLYSPSALPSSLSSSLSVASDLLVPYCVGTRAGNMSLIVVVYTLVFGINTPTGQTSQIRRSQIAYKAAGSTLATLLH